MSNRTTLAVALVVAAAASLAATPAIALDGKAYGLTICMPYAPDTTAAELQFSPTGIYNPGTASEKVFCTLQRDQQETYAANDLRVIVYYRVVGAALQRVTCTLFIGSTSMQAGAVATSTGNGDFVQAGNRGSVMVDGGLQPDGFTQIPNTLLCTVPPKTSIGGIWAREEQATDEEPAPL